MTSLQEVREALAAQVQDNAYPAIQGYANAPDTINVPCVVVVPPRGTFATYGETLGSEFLGGVMGGLPVPVPTATGFRLDTQVMVMRSDLDRAQKSLDQWMAFESIPGITVSIPMAVAMDPTLGGLVRWCNALSADSYGPVDWAGPQYFGARIHWDIAIV